MHPVGDTTAPDPLGAAADAAHAAPPPTAAADVAPASDPLPATGGGAALVGALVTLLAVSRRLRPR